MKRKALLSSTLLALTFPLSAFASTYTQLSPSSPNSERFNRTELTMFTLLPWLLGFLDKGVSLSQTIIPNQGMWRSAKNACFFFVLFFPIGTICGLRYARGGIHEAISAGLAVGLLAGMAGGKGPVFAGFVLIQHFMLRVILSWRGFAPWNYASFLDYATERIFLRKVGGGYIFIHRMLMEHFARMNLGEVRR